MDQTSALLEAKWTLDEDRMGLEKRFEFASYAKALVSQSVQLCDVCIFLGGVRS